MRTAAEQRGDTYHIEQPPYLTPGRAVTPGLLRVWQSWKAVSLAGCALLFFFRVVSSVSRHLPKAFPTLKLFRRNQTWRPFFCYHSHQEVFGSNNLSPCLVGTLLRAGSPTVSLLLRVAVHKVLLLGSCSVTEDVNCCCPS